MGKRAVLDENCTLCGKPMHRPQSLKNRGGKPFCSRSCHTRYMNLTNNPASRDDVKEKIRAARRSQGEGKTYPRLYGRHIHRFVAEQILGRPLQPGEIVHHIDGNKRNNAPENLLVLPSQAAHAALHQQLERDRRQVTQDEIHTETAPAHC